MHQSIDYRKYSILFIDDEEKSLKYFSRIFSNYFNVHCVQHINQAKELLKNRSGEIGVIIVDQRMPEERGINLLKYVKDEYPSIVRILTTAYSELNDAIDAVNNGEIYRYVTKPWDTEYLLEQLHNSMNLYLAQQRERDMLQEKQKIMFQLAGNIAHEMRTPLISINSAAKGTYNYLPRLIDAYNQLSSMNNTGLTIRKKHVNTLESVMTDIVNETQHALIMIDMLLTNIGSDYVNNEPFSYHSIRDCITESLDRYPIRDEQKSLISIDGTDDFIFCGSRLLLIHVFFNLIKNALYAISANGYKGNIRIGIEESDKINRVFFKDTGTGIPDKVMPYVFDDFFSTKSSGTGNNIGIGLPFCKKVLTQIQGSIQCRSQEGVFTEFILNFPRANNTTESADIIPIKLKGNDR